MLLLLDDEIVACLMPLSQILLLSTKQTEETRPVIFFGRNDISQIKSDTFACDFLTIDDILFRIMFSPTTPVNLALIFGYYRCYFT